MHADITFFEKSCKNFKWRLGEGDFFYFCGILILDLSEDRSVRIKAIDQMGRYCHQRKD